MEENKTTHSDILKGMIYALATLSGLLATITQFNADLKGLFSSFGDLPPEAFWVLGLVLLLVGVWGLGSVLKRRSRLRQPDALVLRVSDSTQLKGRAGDIENLSQLCTSESLIYLVGESGSGKTALLLSGLRPKLQANPRTLPVYMAGWGAHWDAGPRDNLRDALHEVWKGEKFLDGDWLAQLGGWRKKTGQVPILLFDQFDDYLSRHRERFYTGPHGTLLSADDLIDVNRFWADIAQLLEADSIRCVFTVRDDASYALEAVRFVNPRQYALSRLSMNLVEPLLDQLTADNEHGVVIANPEFGWTRLRRRLARDLGSEGAVLPAQMKVIFQALTQLRQLTVGEYQREGGLRGLEAAYIARHIIDAGRISKLGENRVGVLLLALVDPQTLKTRGCTGCELAQQLHLSGTGFETALSQALSDLENKKIIRQRLNPDTEELVWTLDHDYLCHGVLETQRRAQRWYALLEEGCHVFLDADGNLLGYWRAMLPTWQQIRIAWECLRGRLRYGGNRNYALWSTFRFAPALVAIALAGMGLFRIEQWQEAEHARIDAETIMAAITTIESQYLPELESNALWQLATATNEQVRSKLLMLVLASRSNAHSFRLRAELLMNAATGLNPARRSAFVNDIVIPCLKDFSPQPEIATACAEMGRLLLAPSVEGEEAAAAIELMLSAVTSTTDESAAAELIEAISTVIDRIPALQATKLLADALPKLQLALPAVQTNATIDLLTNASQRLTGDEASDGFRAVVVAWSTAPERHRPRYRRAMNMLSSRVSSDSRRQVAIEVLGVSPGGSEGVSLLLSEIVLKPMDLNTDERRSVFKALLKLIESHQESLSRLVRSALAVVDTGSTRADSTPLENLGMSIDKRLRALPAEDRVTEIFLLTRDGAEFNQAAINWLYELIARQLEFGQAYYRATARLGGSLSSKPGTMPPSAAIQAFDAILHVIHLARTGEDGDIPDTSELKWLGKGLEKVVNSLTADDSRHAMARLVSTINNPPRDYRYTEGQLAAFARALVAHARSHPESNAINLLKISQTGGSSQRHTMKVILDLMALTSGKNNRDEVILNTARLLKRNHDYDGLLEFSIQTLVEFEVVLPESLIIQAFQNMLVSNSPALPPQMLMAVAKAAGTGLLQNLAASIYKKTIKNSSKLNIDKIEQTKRLLQQLSDYLSPTQAGGLTLELAKKIVSAEGATLNVYYFKKVLQASLLQIRPLFRHLSTADALKTARVLVGRKWKPIGSTAAEALNLLTPRLSAVGRGEIILALMHLKNYRIQSNLLAAAELLVDSQPTAATAEINDRLIEMLKDPRTRKIAPVSIAKMGVALAPSLTGQNRRELARIFAAQILFLHKAEKILSFANVLSVVSNELDAEQRDGISAHIINIMMAPSTASEDLPKLSRALGMIPGRISSNYLEKVFDSLLYRMANLRNLDDQRSLGKALLALPGTLAVPKLIELLKWPTTTGTLRDMVMQRVEQQEYVEFGGDLLKLIRWSESKGFNIYENPRRQIVHEN